MVYFGLFWFSEVFEEVEISFSFGEEASFGNVYIVDGVECVGVDVFYKGNNFFGV